MEKKVTINADMDMKKNKIDLDELYIGVHSMMKATLTANRAFIKHSTSKGNVTEEEWRVFLSRHLPSRFTISQGIIIDSEGSLSKQIDIIIHDSFTTPFLYKTDNFSYVPIESVYAVFEVKQDINKTNLRDAISKIKSVRELKTRFVDEDLQPIEKCRIIGGLLATTSSAKAQEIKLSMSEAPYNNMLDCVCAIDGDSFTVKEDCLTERDWKDNCLQQLPPNKALYVFVFYLLHFLQQCHAMSVDLNAYLPEDSKVQCRFTTPPLF